MNIQSAVPWQGFHHVALATPDLNATIQFYQNVLGMQVGEIYGSGIGVNARHCFIKPEGAETWGLHVFENPDPELKAVFELTKQMVLDVYASGKRLGFLKGILQHIAFALPDEHSAVALRTRLQQHHVLMTPINEIGAIHNFLFLDHNGLLLEAAWPKP